MLQETFVKANHPALQYMGRIDFSDPENPMWINSATCVRVRFTGSFVRCEVTNHRGCWTNYIGAIVDGVQKKYALANEGRQTVTLFEDLPEGEHELLLFKRMDGCHFVTFHGLSVAENAVLSAPEALPDRRIEVYGDSVSAGEVSEAVDYCGLADPPHDGEFSNSYYSYSWMTARKLNAQIHNVSQGGIALLPDTGYFHYPDYQGMEFMYDKMQYNDQILPNKPWNFARYTPHVVVVAIGQNDNHPDPYMDRDYDDPKSRHWRAHYAAFIRKLREIYPKAYIILCTTILNHHPNWDKSIASVVTELDDPKVSQFLFSKNGCGTHGHIRIPEADVMSDELAAYIQTLHKVWED